MNRGYPSYGRGGFGARGGFGGRGGGGMGYNKTDQLVQGIVSAIMSSQGPAPYGAGPYGPYGRGGAPVRGAPMRGAPMRGGPMRGGPMRGGPMRGGPMRGGPMRGGPTRGMRGGATRGARGARGGAPKAGDKRSAAGNTDLVAKKIKPVTREMLDAIEIADEDVVVTEEQKENVNKLRERKEEDIKKNASEEDVKKLRVFSWNGVAYECSTCKYDTVNADTFVNHLNGKGHSVKVVDAKTESKYQQVKDILDMDLSSDDWFEECELANATLTSQRKVTMKMEKYEYNQRPSNFHSFQMDVKKTATKKEGAVVVTSLVESTFTTKDFAGEKEFAAEFIRAVAGFHCTLCTINIRDPKGVPVHLQTKAHKDNLTKYLGAHKEYKEEEKKKNVELLEVLAQHEGKAVLLMESKDSDKAQFLGQIDAEMVRVPSLLVPEDAKKEEEAEEKNAEEKDGEEKDGEDEEEEVVVKEEKEAVGEEAEAEEAAPAVVAEEEKPAAKKKTVGKKK